MPKMKTSKTTAKRFRKTGTGKLRGRKANTSHNLGKKSADRKRRLGRPAVIAEADKRRAARMLGNGDS